MFKFLKKLFKEEQSSETLNLDSIESWFDNKSNVVFYKINNEVTTFNIRLKSILIKLKRAMEKLENAKLKNPNIPQKMIDIMSGNREAYIKKQQYFLDSISNPKDYTDVDFFIDEIESSIDNLLKSTQKSFTVLNEFFEHEVYDAAFQIKKIDVLIKELKNTISRFSLRKINMIQQDIADLKLKIKLEKDIKEKIKKVDDYLSDMEKANEKINNDINNFKDTKEYKELTQLKENRDSLLKEEESNNNGIIQFFSVVGTGLKKYARISTEENLINIYLSDPIKALRSDTNLEIMGILKKMKISIEKDSVVLKDKKKSKTVERINNIDVTFFNNFIDKYNILKEKIKNSNQAIRDSAAIQQTKELNERLNKSKENIRRLNENLDSLHKEEHKINIDALRHELQENLSSTFDIAITIK